MKAGCACCGNPVAADAETCACGAVKQPSPLRYVGVVIALFASMAFAALLVLVPYWLSQLGLSVPQWNPGETGGFGKLLLFLAVAVIFTTVRNRLVAPRWKCPDA